jgi:predicted esterase
MTFASILRHKAPLGLKEAVVGKECMIMHGERDPVIPMSGGRSLYEKLGGDGGGVTLVQRAGKSHSVLPEDREARECLKEFLLRS